MNTAILSVAPADAGRMPAGRVLGAYLAEARSECLRYLRNPGFMSACCVAVFGIGGRSR